MSEIPKLKRGGDKGKISVYVEKDAAELYRMGKHNGWDVCEIARKAVEDALKRVSPQLKQLAEEVPSP
jgi:hypothetical protein